ncbi:hypothetical protein COW36_10260 [bacterium (Candidatus Blackallbacteria) CG17_big_fil_post_rev_8_21_14_2_50_48_46]|uniref:DNA mimic protein DMP19 C-terminal domain-containing protein n=1 Tax=bacterium (Candidatus Blackallbacteria) CG17_big_fil_post_rev_8_21_14_2_50_48_46 TaxID=2014261 RepID=A0A2M7G4Z1_9BACT|nr:MAG: hypothetical protein COW64_20030 [bacterium (Candidatus Blackallbacteria) CG18_big_fil_WC_8_21_14_2_50_49_26]PIW17016.1 MAG: hypothetical protein COW36_10260 [bacterium (Candidatus Blackallbacteria) CG17_big_fil_post_rev_8_21_14_2_50_48_46]PIW48176.1 MAG: hypothetical protein COW20_10415 [bacterium (Candidatus Blackallbacteria) CG13_big_fil_rev_8_21_14_2_50_49_14]
MKKFTLLLLFSLNACSFLPAKAPLRSRIETQAKTLKSLAEYPRIKQTSFQQLRSAKQQSRYICSKVDDYLQDQLIRSQDFSNRFFLRQLKKLPLDLSWSYATCYLERELKIDGFEGYFRRTRGLLVLEALQGYRAFGLDQQVEILRSASQQYLKNQASDAINKANFQALNQRWFSRQSQLDPARANYFSLKIAAWLPPSS